MAAPEGEPTTAALADQISQVAAYQEDQAARTNDGIAELARASTAMMEHVMTATDRSSRSAGSTREERIAASPATAQNARQRKDDQNAATEREKVALDTTGYKFRNQRAQIVAVLRLCTGGEVLLAPDQYGQDAYTTLIGLTAAPAMRSPGLTTAGSQMNHLIATYLTELMVTNNINCEGLGAAETPYSTPSALHVKPSNISQQLKMPAGRLQKDRKRAATAALRAEDWCKNRKVLSRLLGGYVGAEAGQALCELVDDEFTKMDGDESYTVENAEEIFFDVISAWTAAATELLTRADVGKYMDVYDTVEIVQGHLATWPTQSVSLPSLVNYPDVEADIRECEAGLLASSNRRRTAEERQRLLKVHSPGSARTDDAKAGAARAGESVGAAGGDDSRRRDSGTSGRRESRSAVRRRAVKERTEKEKAAAVASAVAAATRAGALSGAPGGTPVGVADDRFVLLQTTKSAASGKDPKHGDKFICRRCCSWPVRHGKAGKEVQIPGWGGPRIHKCPGLADYHHAEYTENTLVPAAVLANMVVMGGSTLLPETNTCAKQKVAHDLLMADGVTRTAADWRKWAVTQKFGAANPPASNLQLAGWSGHSAGPAAPVPQHPSCGRAAFPVGPSPPYCCGAARHLRRGAQRYCPRARRRRH